MAESYISQIASYGRPAELPFLGSPLEEMGEAIITKGKAKGQTDAAVSGLGDLKWDALSVDTEEREADLAAIQQASDALTEKLQNEGLNPSTRKELADLRKSVQAKLQPGGSIYLQQQRHNQFTAYEKSLAEKQKKNEISANDYNRLRTEALISIKKSKETDGMSPTLPLQTVADNKYKEAADHAYKIANDMMITTTEGFSNYANQKGLPPEELLAFQHMRKERPKEFITKIARLELQRNKEFEDYFDQEARLNTVDDFYGPRRGLFGQVSKEAFEKTEAENPNLDPNSPEFQDALDKNEYRVQQPYIHEQFKQKLINEIADNAGDIYQRSEQTLTPHKTTDTEIAEGIKYRINNPISWLTLQDPVLPVKNPMGADLKSANEFIDNTKTQAGNVEREFLQEYVDKNKPMNDTGTKVLTVDDLLRSGYNMEWFRKNPAPGFSPAYVAEKIALKDHYDKNIRLAEQRKKEAENKYIPSQEDKKLLEEYAQANPTVNLADPIQQNSLKNYGGEYEAKVLAAFNKKEKEVNLELGKDQQVSTWSMTAMPGYATKLITRKDPVTGVLRNVYETVEDEKKVHANTVMVNKFFQSPGALAGFKLITEEEEDLNNMDKLREWFGATDIKDIKIGTVSLTTTPGDVGSSSGGPSRAFVIPLSVGDKVKRVKVTTDQIHSPEIKALLDDPYERANVEYETGRIAQVKKYDIYNDGRVIIDYGELGKKDDKFIINGVVHTGAEGLSALGDALKR